jgi:mRNA interferase HigB
MRVHLIRKQAIENYEKENARSRSSFQLWMTVVKNVDWNRPEDIQETFGSADILGKGSNRVVFDIGGKNYRMICHYVFGEKQVHLFICWIGTHSDYTKLCNVNKQYTINNF